MARTYTLRKRAEQQAETRQRIVEAAVELHGSVGPAATTVSMVADRAGVQRHTFYAYFPDERSLLTACSGLVQDRDPPPDPAAWRRIADRRRRLSTGLGVIYDYYKRNAALFSCVLRDAEYHALTREITELRYGPSKANWETVLGADLSARQRSVLVLALSFYTWRTLAGEAGLEQAGAVEAMVRAIECADGD
jgi:AcrR family transcriptional regulator